MFRRKFRVEVRNNRESPEGQVHICFGIRVGYWPCLLAPYVQLAFWKWRLDIWHGLPSLAQVEKGDA
jgi:hypothetical protein